MLTTAGALAAIALIVALAALVQHRLARPFSTTPAAESRAGISLALSRSALVLRSIAALLTVVELLTETVNRPWFVFAAQAAWDISPYAGIGRIVWSVRQNPPASAVWFAGSVLIAGLMIPVLIREIALLGHGEMQYALAGILLPAFQWVAGGVTSIVSHIVESLYY